MLCPCLSDAGICEQATVSSPAVIVPSSCPLLKSPAQLRMMGAGEEEEHANFATCCQSCEIWNLLPAKSCWAYIARAAKSYQKSTRQRQWYSQIGRASCRERV